MFSRVYSRRPEARKLFGSLPPIIVVHEGQSESLTGTRRRGPPGFSSISLLAVGWR